MAWSSRRRSSLVSIVAAVLATAGLAAATAVAQPKGKPAPAPAPAAGDAGSGSAGAGSGSAAAPAGAPGEAAAVTEAAEAGEGADVDALRQEYLKLRDELFASRARAAAVASTLYSTKVTIKLTYGSGRFYNVRRATIRLDGANVFDDTEGAIASNDAVRFEGYVAPGRHLLTVRIAAAGKDDDRFTSTTETTAVVFAAQGKDLTDRRQGRRRRRHPVPVAAQAGGHLQAVGRPRRQDHQARGRPAGRPGRRRQGCRWQVSAGPA